MSRRPGAGGPDYGTVLMGGLILLVSVGFLGLSLYVTTSSRAGNAMMKLIALFGGVALGGAGIYTIYKGIRSGENPDDRRPAERS